MYKNRELPIYILLSCAMVRDLQNMAASFAAFCTILNRMLSQKQRSRMWIAFVSVLF